MAAPDPELDITSWTDLAGLPDDMEVLADQLRSISAYARRWVCQSAGFEPSPLCLLRPLGRLMDLLAEGFDELERLGLADWASLRAGVVDTTGEMRGLDAEVAGRLPAVA